MKIINVKLSSSGVSRIIAADEEGNKLFEFIDDDNIVVTDGYHSMNELYQHRMALNIALFHAWYNTDVLVDNTKVIKSKFHHDGTMFDGYFIVMAITPEGQISYHYKLKHWDKFKIPEVEKTPEWDGHGSLQVIERLMKL